MPISDDELRKMREEAEATSKKAEANQRKEADNELPPGSEAR